MDINTPIFNGVKGLKVTLEHSIDNPYKGIVDMALATWGSDIHKWEKMIPEERFGVFTKVMQRRALPLGRECPIFLFGIDGASRASFDQIARQRIGSTFSSLGWNNVHNATGFRISNEIIENNSEWESEISIVLEQVKTLYKKMIDSGISWQSSRALLPLGLIHKFYFSVTYEALIAFCSRRLCFSEMEDTVAVAWLMRERVKEKFPLMATYLRPSCDQGGKCSYHPGDSLPEEMGTLFLSCGRNPMGELAKNKTNEELGVFFNRPSTMNDDLENDLGIYIPKSFEQKSPDEFYKLDIKDKELFSAC
jgi:thymidylate synthase ThyX